MKLNTSQENSLLTRRNTFGFSSVVLGFTEQQFNQMPKDVQWWIIAHHKTVFDAWEWEDVEEDTAYVFAEDMDNNGWHYALKVVVHEVFKEELWTADNWNDQADFKGYSFYSPREAVKRNETTWGELFLKNLQHAEIVKG